MSLSLRRRLLIEALVLLTLLGARGWALLNVASPRGLLAFTERPGTDLLGGAKGRLERQDGRVRVRARGDAPSKVRLGAVDLEPGKAYLLVVRASQGDPFALRLFDRSTSRVVGDLPFSPGDSGGTLAAELNADHLPSDLRVNLLYVSSRDLVLEALELRELGPGATWAPRLLRLLGPVLVVAFVVRHRRPLLAHLGLGPRTSDRALERSSDAVLALLVFLLCITVYRMAPVQQLMDARYITVASHSLLRSGTLALPDGFEPLARSRRAYMVQKVGDRARHFYPEATAVLNAPFVAVFGWLGVSPIKPDGAFHRPHELYILRVVAAFLAAATCAMLYLLARLWLPPGTSLLLSVVFAFGTQLFSTISRAFWSHTWSVFLLSTALYLLFSSTLRGGRWVDALAATSLCWASFCRPILILSILGVGLYLLLDRSRRILPFAVTGLAWAGLFVVYSMSVFDQLAPPYFMLLASRVTAGLLGGGVESSGYPTGLAGTMISPGRGLLVYVPIVVLILWAVVRRWRWIPEKSLALTALAVCFAHWQLVSLSKNWWGGQCFGARLMSDILPWLFVLAALALAAVRAAAEAGAFRWTALKVAIVLVLVAASCFINTRGAFARETLRGAGIWNWRYPHFLSGLIPRPDAEQR